MKIPRINFSTVLFCIAAGAVVFALSINLATLRENALRIIAESRSSTITAYEQIYCFDGKQGEEYWFKARSFLMANHPDSLSCEFAGGRK